MCMVNSNVYIGNHAVIDFDQYTAELDNGTMYIWGPNEYKKFFKAMGTYLELGFDAQNMFTTYKKDNFTFMDCRRTLKGHKNG